MKNVILMSFLLLAFVALTSFSPVAPDNKSPGITWDGNFNIQNIQVQSFGEVPIVVSNIQNVEISVVAEISEAPVMPLLMEVPKSEKSEYISYIPDAPIYQVFHPCNT